MPADASDPAPAPTGTGSRTPVRTIFRYAPALHAPPAAATMSPLQLSRQFSPVGRSATIAGPNANPFWGAMLPIATCTGSLVASVAAQLKAVLKLLQSSLIASPSSRNSDPSVLSPS